VKAIIDKSVGFPIACLSVAKIRTLLKWRLNGQTPKGRKDALVNQFNSLAEPVVPVWTAEQENRYLHLKNEDISIQETALGCACEAMVEGVVANIDHISVDAFEKLIRELVEKNSHFQSMTVVVVTTVIAIVIIISSIVPPLSVYLACPVIVSHCSHHCRCWCFGQ